MASESRWFRLNVDWDDTEWVYLLSPQAQLAWIKLLCLVKRDGRNGAVKALSEAVACSKWRITADNAVSEMLAAAKAQGALIEEDARWRIARWDLYQTVDATRNERQSRFRNAIREKAVTEDNAVALSRATLTGTGTKTKNSENCPPSLLDYLPDRLRTASVAQAWDRYASHRREKKIAPYTPSGLQTLAKRLIDAELSGDRIAELIDECVAGNWNGIPPDRIKRRAAADEPPFRVTRLPEQPRERAR